MVVLLVNYLVGKMAVKMEYETVEQMVEKLVEYSGFWKASLLVAKTEVVMVAMMAATMVEM